MSKTVRIRTTPNGSDSYLKLKVEQDFDFIEILSLKISQAEAYARFCSDYGVIVGRVIVNNGFGVPNAKVSVFIPISDEDKEDSEIAGLYPFETIDDKDNEGVRYNLLQKDPNPYETCFTPVGSFPSKREVIDNDTVLEVYCKYYKFTTTTNDAGDFMLFGVPTGPQTVNVDVDLSDIGIASQRPYDYIAQGEDKKRFESPTKFKGDKDLDKLIQIKSYKKAVNVQPFWGDKDQCDIGITRLDVDIKKRIEPSAIFIGSLFSDTEKNSINKNCRPRKDFGRLCETETGEGSVEMIRKNLDGKIERFDIEGGRVVDEFGTWAYQIPMNLDYMVTDEFGNLVPSDDPNKGIATKARVRFRVGKDVTGSEGRLRTTAKYLVPHNPPNAAAIDYNFDENTTDEHFRDFHWNKIYTVANFIPRVQAICPSNKCADNRNITGIKDVDDCTGLKTPFPYNRVDTDFNPLFLIICIILSIIVFIVWMINSIVIALVNIIIWIINGILEVICKIVFGFAKTICGLIAGLSFGTFDKDNCKKKGCIGKYSGGDCDCKSIIKYVPCIVLECDDKHWAPGCDCSDSDALNSPVGDTDPSSAPSGDVGVGSLGCWAATTNENSPKNIVHWSGLAFSSSNCGHDGHNTIGAGVTDCYAIQLAEALNMFEFDFYNDWVNGTLYTYLLKYKKKKNGKQKFCDTDCDSPDSDNRCDKSWFVDTCVKNDDDRESIKNVTKKSIDEGFIKLVSKKLPNGQEVETLYYTPYSYDANAKLFATELIHLGSVFDCDWQGIPKIQPYLTATSYKRPPYTAEYLDDNTTKIACGMTSTGGNGSGGLFFDIDCIGLTVGQNQNGWSRCNNFKRICEHGVNIDEADFDSNNNPITTTDCYINETDIVQPWGRLFRDTFMRLNANDGPTKLNSWSGIGIAGANTSLGTGENAGGADYLSFRGTNSNNSYNTVTDPSTSNYTQPKNSFYFYFGTAPNRTAVDNMNRKYFTECEFVEVNDFVVSAIITDASTSNSCDGQINTTVVGGEAPYTYVWSGPNGYTNTETIGDIINLCAGNYSVTVTDANGESSTTTFTVNAPAALSCSVTATPAINAGGNGQIQINAFGGSPTYSYSINGNPSVIMAGAYETVPSPAGTYIVTVSDSNGATCTNPLTGVTITEPPVLSLGSQVVWTHTTCGDNNGTIQIQNPSQANIGGLPPYTFSITGPSSYSSTLTNVSGLVAGTYTVTVSDGSPTTPQIDSQTVTINPSVAPTLNYTPSWYCWIYPNVPQIFPALSVTANGGFTIVATPRDASNQPVPAQAITQSYGAGITSVVMSAPSAQPFQPLRYDFELTDSDGCVAYTFGDFRPGFGQVPSNPLRLELANPSDKYCWISGGNKEILPQFQVWVDGPFTIKQGTTVIYTEPTGVPAGTIVTIPSIITVPANNITSFTLVDTTHPTCFKTLPNVDFSPQVPTGPLNATASQIGPNICLGGSPSNIQAFATNGYGPYTYLWYINGVPTTITSVIASVPLGSCGQVWKCKITDSEGCIKFTNNVTII